MKTLSTTLSLRSTGSICRGHGEPDYAHALLFNDRCDEARAQIHRIASGRPPLLRAAPIAAQLRLQNSGAEAVAVLQPQRDRDPVSLALSGYMMARARQREQALRGGGRAGGAPDAVARGRRTRR
jgi:hypothetical protein